MDLFERASAAVLLPESAERAFAFDMASGAFVETPTEQTWQWADREVWLSSKQTAEAKQYDSSLTPWTRKIQELPMNDRGIKVAAVMKDTRSGFTEAGHNIIRRMPEFWPGPALYAINSRDKAREVSEFAYLPFFLNHYGTSLVADPKDISLSKINLRNMRVTIAGSGSSGPFMQSFYRFIFLDEMENHEQTQETTTLDRAISRQKDVPDGLLYVISKAEKAGGIIHMAFIRGTQEKYLVPCPRCERLFEFVRKGLTYGHCKNENGTWNQQSLLRDTFYTCPHCSKPVYNHEKRAMVNHDPLNAWTPTPEDQRQKHPKTNQYVPADPVYASFHISSLYSLHDDATFGHLAKDVVFAEELMPTPNDRKRVSVDLFAIPWSEDVVHVEEATIRALIAGHRVMQKVALPDGTSKDELTVLAPSFLTGNGRDGSYGLAFIRDKRQALLGFRPDSIRVFIDKQKSQLKASVFALMADGQALLIDIIYVVDEDAMFELLRDRFYDIALGEERMQITGGFMDSRYFEQTVYRFCLRCYYNLRPHGMPMQLWPVRGEGENKKNKGRIIRHVQDKCDLGPLTVRYFNDYQLKCETSFNKIGQRSAPRIWLPRDVPDGWIKELTAEPYDEETQSFIRDDTNKRELGPNDFYDTFKFVVLWLIENMGGLAAAGEEAPPEDEDTEKVSVTPPP